MAEVVHITTTPLAAAMVDMADRCARMARVDGDGRTTGQLRSAVVTDLVLRPWDTSRAAVTAHLTVLAPLPTLHQRPGVTRSTRPAGLHALATMVPVPDAELIGPVDDPPPF
jgi:hypothetical protein